MMQFKILEEEEKTGDNCTFYISSGDFIERNIHL